MYTPTVSKVTATAPYVPASGRFLDEAFDADGTVRELYRELLAGYEDADLPARAEAIAVELAERGVAFGGDDGWPFLVDQVPRLIAADEWAWLEAGLRRRAATLEAFVADMHGPRRCIADGVVPPTVLDGCPFHERDLDGLPDPPTARVTIAGMDLVRDDDGELLVLEDNCRTPSGLAYALAAADAVRARHDPPRGLRDYRGALRRTLRTMLDAALPPAAPADACTVMLSDGPANTAWWEHRTLAELSGADLLLTDELVLDGDLLRSRDSGRPIGVAYRRTNIDRLRDDDGRPTALGELMLRPLQAGTLVVLNAFGTGIADDKRVHAHVDELTRYYLGEEPIVRSVPSLDLTSPGALEQALDRAADLVFKPRDGHGGHGVVIGPAASDAELAALRATVTAQPEGWIAQECVSLSTHPTAVDGRLAARHVDLRPFVIATGRRSWDVLPGGLTRVALNEGELVVNSSRGGGGKDTWVLS